MAWLPLQVQFYGPKDVWWHFIKIIGTKKFLIFSSKTPIGSDRVTRPTTHQFSKNFENAFLKIYVFNFFKPDPRRRPNFFLGSKDTTHDYTQYKPCTTSIATPVQELRFFEIFKVKAISTLLGGL